MAETEEGKQVQLLRVILRKAMEDATDSFPVCEALAGVPNVKKGKLKRFSDIFKKTISKAMEESIDSLIKDEDIDMLLKKREELIESQKEFEGTIAWRPTGSVVDDMRSYNMNVLKAKRQQATILCEKEEREMETLFAEVLKARKEAQNCQMLLDAAQSNLEKLSAVLENQQDAHTRITHSLYTLNV